MNKYPEGSDEWYFEERRKLRRIGIAAIVFLALAMLGQIAAFFLEVKP